MPKIVEGIHVPSLAIKKHVREGVVSVYPFQKSLDFHDQVKNTSHSEVEM